MIVYVATYPRCGSGLLRNIVVRCFDGAVASAHDARDRPRQLPTDDPAIVRPKPALMRPSPLFMIREPAYDTLTPDVRERLGAKPDALYVKTHDLPFDHWFEGEVALQMVRHPAAAILSHSKLTNEALQDHIEGRCHAGRWADYHAAWREAELPISRPRYEDNFDVHDDAIAALERLTGQPATTRSGETAAESTARNPERNPGRGPYGWRTLLSVESIDRIWEVHGHEAERYGYDRLGLTRQTA